MDLELTSDDIALLVQCLEVVLRDLEDEQDIIDAQKVLEKLVNAYAELNRQEQ